MGIVDAFNGTKPASRPRFRTLGTFAPIIATYTSIDETCSSGSVFNGSYYVSACNGKVRETWDMVTPNFTKRQRNGELITNPYRTMFESQESSGHYARAKQNAPSCTSPTKNWVIDLGGPQAYSRLPGGTDVYPARLRQTKLITQNEMNSAGAVASTAAWNKSNEHSADILVDIAEFSKTLRMLRDPIQTTSTFLRKIKAGKSGAKSVTSGDVIDYASSLWLQYRYGIRPLVKSVQGVVKALESIHFKRRQTYRGSYPLIKTESLVSGSCSGNPISFTYNMFHTDELSVRTGLVIEESVSLSQELGVDASGMLSLPWELVPFSFVADWFANVNDYFGALVPYLTKSPLSSWTTYVRRSSTVFTVTGTTAISGWTLERAAVETRTAVFEEKIRNVGLQGPSVAFKPRAISRVYNDLRIIDAFSLLQKQFLQVFKP